MKTSNGNQEENVLPKKLTQVSEVLDHLSKLNPHSDSDELDGVKKIFNSCSKGLRKNLQMLAKFLSDGTTPKKLDTTYGSCGFAQVNSNKNGDQLEIEVYTMAKFQFKDFMTAARRAEADLQSLNEKTSDSKQDGVAIQIHKKSKNLALVRGKVSEFIVVDAYLMPKKV